jgi:DNA (cytosine-5)-methyltransferase 1
MTAYYNEHDPFAAAWLRELIADGLIAPGEVDERSIEDVRPDELAGFVQCHFFAGIGVWSLALRQAGVPRRLSALDRILSMPAFQRGRQRRWVC